MDEHTTYPALLATETIPVPLTIQPSRSNPPLNTDSRSPLGTVIKLAVLVLLVWALVRISLSLPVGLP
jgi:hypothetical protein